MYFHRPATGPLEIIYEPPSSARVYAPVKLGKSALLHLADSRAPSEPLTPPSPLHYNVHVLKSNIQKAIRRGANEAALATAQQLIYQDANEFVRRLPILMTEDAQLVPTLFVECVWLMVAVSKGYVLATADNTVLLTTVASCLAAKGRYNLHAEIPGDAIRRAAADTVALAFTLRIAFGGMSGDMAFLGRLHARWCAGELPCAEAVAAVTSAVVEPFTPTKHLLPIAMDFHCFKHMLRECGGGLTKDVVWWHCSSPNFRAPIGIGGADLVATEAQRREETAAEFAAHRDSIAAFQATRLRESCVGAVPTPQFKQMSIESWVKKVGTASQ